MDDRIHSSVVCACLSLIQVFVCDLRLFSVAIDCGMALVGLIIGVEAGDRCYCWHRIGHSGLAGVLVLFV